MTRSRALIPSIFTLTLAFALALVSILPARAWAQPGEIFSDDFESGDTSSWSQTFGLPEAPGCVVGPAIPGVLEGDLGPAPAAPGLDVACLAVDNDRPFARSVETAFSGVPIPRQLGLADGDLERLVLIGPGNRLVPAQFDVLSRWGGPLADTALPIRWLEVSTQVPVDAGDRTVVALRLLDEAPSPAVDPFEATVVETRDAQGAGGAVTIDTGVATFVLDPSDPVLVTSISIATLDDGAGRVMAYVASPGAGPRLVFDDGGPVVLGTANAGTVSVDAGSFEIVERGPVKVVVAQRGHFSAPGGASLCTAVTPAYERFGYTAVATFHRGRRDVDLRFHVRNECSNASGNPFTDDAVVVDEASWQWPLASTFTGTRSHYHAGAGAVTASPPGFSGDTVVEQRKGAGDPWQRRARVLRAGAELESGTFFERPLVALAADSFVAAVQMPYVRYREPQALAARDSTLVAAAISEPLTVGEAKAVWSVHRLTLRSRQQASAGQSLETWLEDLRGRGLASLERGLMVHADAAALEAAGLFSTFGDPDVVSGPEDYYRSSLDFIHQETVSANGQWQRNKTYGSQIWPDVQFDQFSTAPTPFANAVRSNYWNPFGAEMREWMRTGEPRWVWDFALPQSWHQAYAAFLNLGHRSHGNRNGFTVSGTGTGEGQWNRDGNLSSDDYNYNMGMQLAYALRPEVTLRHRFDQVGLTALERYDLPKSQEGQREPFVNQVNLSRGVIQHFEHLANCAEFSPGQRGIDCHDRLVELLEELVADNASSGVFCGGDVPDFASPCSTPQQFMLNAHIYHFFDRLERNYGDVGPGLTRALVEAPRAFYLWGMPKLAGGVSIDTFSAWPNGLECTLTGDGQDVVSCAGWTGGDPTFFQNYPHTLALLLMAQLRDPSIGLCQVTRDAMDQLVTAGALDSYLTPGAGWFKGSAQVMQGLVLGVGAYETCADP